MIVRSPPDDYISITSWRRKSPQVSVVKLRRMSVYWSFARSAFLEILAYRMRYVTGWLTYLLFVTVHYFIWEAVFRSALVQESGGEPILAGQAVINGFTLPQMVTYVAIGWISRSLYFSNIDYDIDSMVRKGEISGYLMRPVDFHLMAMSKATGEAVFRAFCFTLPMSILILGVFPINAPISIASGCMFAVSIVAAFWILAQLNFMVGCLSFYFESVSGFSYAKYYLLQLFSGLLLPLAFFPTGLQPILEWLPFKMLASVPLQIYLGKIAVSDSYHILGEMAVWCIALTVLARLVYYRASMRLVIHGG